VGLNWVSVGSSVDLLVVSVDLRPDLLHKRSPQGAVLGLSGEDEVLGVAPNWEVVVHGDDGWNSSDVNLGSENSSGGVVRLGHDVPPDGLVIVEKGLHACEEVVIVVVDQRGLIHIHCTWADTPHVIGTKYSGTSQSGSSLPANLGSQSLQDSLVEGGISPVETLVVISSEGVVKVQGRGVQDSGILKRVLDSVDRGLAGESWRSVDYTAGTGFGGRRGRLHFLAEISSIESGVD
jgi:hypothetical protein